MRPLPFLNGVQYQLQHSASLSDSITAQAPAHQADVLADTEHDAEEQWKFEPVKKRRGKEESDGGSEAKQGVLF